MSILEINNRKFSLDEKDYLNIQSLIPKIQKQFPQDEYEFTHLKLNGNSIDPSSQSHELFRPISAADHIDFNFTLNGDDSKRISDPLSSIIDNINSHIVHYCKIINDGSDNKELLGNIIEYIALFVEAVQTIKSELPLHRETLSSLPIQELQIHLLSIIKGINIAHTGSDSIMLVDLLEYELNDNLKQWKILVIPTLKQLTQS